MKRDGFSSRLGLVIAALGMAIGTGNIWRFPRIAAKYDGGAFLVPWLIFLVTWSIPILVAEFTLGKTTRRGPVGAFARLLGPQTAWMGAFMAFTTLMIATYYSVVTGWVLKYLKLSITGDLDFGGSLAEQHAAAVQRFNTFTQDPVQPVYYHLAAVAVGIAVVWWGVKGGVERFCKVLIPTLFVVLLGGVIWALTNIDGAIAGLNYFFNPDWSKLKESTIWIDALSQSAWSTGAGWGLILTYGAYARRDEDAVVNNCTAAFGNNFASVLAGLFIFPAAFGLLGAAGMGAAEISGALKDSGPASTGLAFQYVPFIFQSLPEHGALVTTIFFACLFVAALSSLIAMYEMGIHVLTDLGLSRHKAVIGLGIACAGIGVPSAMDMDFFITMDWVWGLGLVVGGLMVVGAVQLYGIQAYREKLINATADLKLKWGFNWAFLYLIPIQGVAMLGWWLHEGATNEGYYGAGNDPWDPLALGTYNVGTPVIWCAAAMVLFMLVSPWLGRWSLAGDDDEENAE